MARIIPFTLQHTGRGTVYMHETVVADAGIVRCTSMQQELKYPWLEFPWERGRGFRRPQVYDYICLSTYFPRVWFLYELLDEFTGRLMKLFLVTERHNRVRRTFHVSVPRQGPSGLDRFRMVLCASPAAPDLPKDKYLRALHYALWNIFFPSSFLSSFLSSSPTFSLSLSLSLSLSFALLFVYIIVRNRIIIAISSRPLSKFCQAHCEETTRPYSPSRSAVF